MITSQDYKFVSDQLGSAQFTGRGMYNSLGDMVRHLDANELSDNNLDKHLLRTAILDTYRIILQSHVFVTDEMARTVRALQNHVLKQYDSVDDFLATENIKVSSDFAVLSAVVGYEISFENIE
jgi:hypothetical protein